MQKCPLLPQPYSQGLHLPGGTLPPFPQSSCKFGAARKPASLPVQLVSALSWDPDGFSLLHVHVQLVLKTLVGGGGREGWGRARQGLGRTDR